MADGGTTPAVATPARLPEHIKHARYGTPSATWHYRDESGALLFTAARFETEDGKVVLPLTCTRDGWQWKAPAAPRPLYNLPGLAARPNDTVLIVEGEKTAEAAARLFPNLVCVTWQGGACATGKADWRPLAGRTVIVWPDNDDPGRKAAAAVAHAAANAGAACVAIVDVPTDWPAGWDLADPLPDGVDADTIAHMLTEALAIAAAEDCRQPDGDAPVRTGRPRKADELIKLAQSATLYRTPDGTAYADITVDGHRETWPIRSRGFRLWLAHQYYALRGGATNAEAMQEALGVIEAMALFGPTTHDVHLRACEHDGRIYIDLCDPQWRAIEVSADGWRIIDTPPVRFRRSPGVLPLPEPARGGSIFELRELINIPNEEALVLATSWLLAALRGKGPFPLLCVSGEQGSAKSSFIAVMRSLVDPHTAPLRSLPRDDRDLFVQANNGYVLAYDNLSHLQPEMSDNLCRLATGGGFTARRLYTDDEEVLFNACRPIMMNGISDVVGRPDLADRTIFLALLPISEERRRPERELWQHVEAARPRLLGVLLDAVSHGLRTLPHIRPDRLPRMADLSMWVQACEGALWKRPLFAEAYERNRTEATHSVLEADHIASAVIELMEAHDTWTGTATGLLSALAEVAGDRVSRAKAWPQTPQSLTSRLRRAAPALRRLGIETDFGREGRQCTRVVRIHRTKPER